MEPEYGWGVDPYGIHEHRYFSGGLPTKLVRDSGRESYDEPPPGPPPTIPHRPAQAIAHPPIGVSGESNGAVTATIRARPWRRLRIALVGVFVLTTAGIVFAITGSTPQMAACSLLSDARVSAILNLSVTQENGAGHANPIPNLSSCIYQPSPSETSKLEREGPEGFAEASANLSLTLERAPSSFPDAALRKVGAPTRLLGLTLWWAPVEPRSANVNLVPDSERVLLAVKDGYEVIVGSGSLRGAASVDRQAMTDVLRTI